MWSHTQTIRTAKSGADAITLADVKGYIRTTSGDSENGFLELLIDGAHEVAEENYVSLREATFETTYTRRGFVGHYANAFRLPMYPATAINSVSVRSTSANVFSALEGDPVFNAEEYALVLLDLHTYRSVKISYTAGFNDSRELPPQMKLGLLAACSVQYELRDGWATTPPTFLDALDSYRSRYCSCAEAFYLRDHF